MADECTPELTSRLVRAIRKQNPLVQCVTNYVSMDLMANVLLAAGASPAMVRLFAFPRSQHASSASGGIVEGG